MNDELFDEISQVFKEQGSTSAIQSLIDALARAGDHHRLFEAMTMQARHDLGVALLRGSEGADLPLETRTALEDRMIAACRTVGQRLLDSGDITGGYQYLNMIGELDPVRRAIESATPGEEELGAIIEIALSRGVHPVRGIDLVLRNYGLCQAISACESLAQVPGPVSASDRNAAVRLVLAGVHEELKGRLREEIERREGQAPKGDALADWLATRESLFADDNYHIDTSHLQAVVRLARTIEEPSDVRRAMELCDYGTHLSSKYCYADPAPFEDFYPASRQFFAVLAGEDVEAGLEYFKSRALAGDPRSVGGYPTEVYLHLLRVTGRSSEAIEFVDQSVEEPAATTAPVLSSLCESTGDFDALARFARKRRDPITFLAALLLKQGESQ